MTPRTQQILLNSLVAGVIVVFAALGVMLRSSQDRLLSGEGGQLCQSVESGKGWLKGNPVSPLSARLAGGLRKSFDMETDKALDALSAVGFAATAGLVFWALSAWLGTFWSALSVVLFALTPTVAGQFGTLFPSGVFLLALLGPALLLMVGAGIRAPGRLGLFLLAGLLGGLAVFLHPLGIWTTLTSFVALFLCIDRRPSPRGRISLPDIGLETVLLLVGFLGALVIGWLAMKGHKDDLIRYWFGRFMDPQPATAFGGIVYRPGREGAPPFWSVLWLWMVRTPLGVLVLALLSVPLTALGHLERVPRRVGLLLAPGLPLLLVGMLSGSTFPAPGLELLPGLALLPAVAAVVGLKALWKSFEGLVARLSLVVLTALLLLHGATIQWALYPFSMAYANVLAGGTGSLLAQGTDFLPEPVVEESVLAELKGHHRLTVVPFDGELDRLFSALLSKKEELRVRDGGPYPLLLTYRPSSPGWRLWRKLSGSEPPELSRDIAGVRIWGLYLNAGRKP